MEVDQCAAEVDDAVQSHTRSWMHGHELAGCICHFHHEFGPTPAFKVRHQMWISSGTAIFFHQSSRLPAAADPTTV